MTRAGKFASIGFFGCVAAMLLAACATNRSGANGGEQPVWAANGWMAADASGEPQIIGQYLTRRACRAALKAWMANQSDEGKAASGTCLPIDRK